MGLWCTFRLPSVKEWRCPGHPGPKSTRMRRMKARKSATVVPERPSSHCSQRPPLTGQPEMARMRRLPPSRVCGPVCQHQVLTCAFPQDRLLSLMLTAASSMSIIHRAGTSAMPKRQFNPIVATAIEVLWQMSLACGGGSALSRQSNSLLCSSDLGSTVDARHSLESPMHIPQISIDFCTSGCRENCSVDCHVHQFNASQNRSGLASIATKGTDVSTANESFDVATQGSGGWWSCSVSFVADNWMHPFSRKAMHYGNSSCPQSKSIFGGLGANWCLSWITHNLLSTAIRLMPAIHSLLWQSAVRTSTFCSQERRRCVLCNRCFWLHVRCDDVWCVGVVSLTSCWWWQRAVLRLVLVVRDASSSSVHVKFACWTASQPASQPVSGGKQAVKGICCAKRSVRDLCHGQGSCQG